MVARLFPWTCLHVYIYVYIHKHFLCRIMEIHELRHMNCISHYIIHCDWIVQHFASVFVKTSTHPLLLKSRMHFPHAAKLNFPNEYWSSANLMLYLKWKVLIFHMRSYFWFPGPLFLTGISWTTILFRASISNYIFINMYHPCPNFSGGLAKQMSN